MASKKGLPPIVYIIGVIAVGFGGYLLYQLVFSSNGNGNR